jgi:hypothetical protein
MTENSRVQFRTEVFYLTNTPNFGVPQQTLGTPDFGTINNTANAGPQAASVRAQVFVLRWAGRSQDSAPTPPFPSGT